MPFDSTAELFFKIGADSSDAEGNIRRFRSVLSKDLGGMAGEFKSWSNSVFGNFTTLKGGLIGLAAAGAAATVALGVAFKQAGDRAAEYAGQIEDGMDATGLSAEEMSRLRFTAKQTGVEYAQLVSSLVKFQVAIAAARKSSGEQRDAFDAVGIKLKDLNEGSKNLYPLLLKTADGFKGLGSNVDKVSLSNELFSKGGFRLLEMLSLGSTGIERYNRKADELRATMTGLEVDSGKAFKMMKAQLEAQNEALTVHLGIATLKWRTYWDAVAIGFKSTAVETLTDPKRLLLGVGHLSLAVNASIKAYSDAQEMMRLATAPPGGKTPPPLSPKIKESVQGFDELSDILERVQTRTRALAGDEEQIAAEIAHLNFEVGKAREKFAELAAQGKLTGETFTTQTAALLRLPAMVAKLGETLTRELDEKRAKEAVAAGREIQEKILEQAEETFEGLRAAFLREIELRKQKLQEEKRLTAENAAALAEYERAGLNKIARERSAAYVRELQDLQQHLAQMISRRLTTRDRLDFEYQREKEKFSEVEEAKSKETAKGEAERAAITEQYAINRRAALESHDRDLQALTNSEGWRGVFGDAFRDSIRQNEQLLREWAETTNQASMMVRVALESLKDIGRQAFVGLTQGMAQNVAYAIVYQKSIGEAMRAALAATLQSVAARALVEAVYATGIGFLALALHDYVAATNAFTAAAVFGSVGVAAAVAGRAIAPRQDATGARDGGAGGLSGQGTGSAAPGASERAGTNVYITITGHVVGTSGIEELTQMINDAVKDRDVHLVATRVKETAPFIR